MHSWPVCVFWGCKEISSIDTLKFKILIVLLKEYRDLTRMRKFTLVTAHTFMPFLGSFSTAATFCVEENTPHFSSA